VICVIGLISQRRRYATSASEKAIAKPIATATTVSSTCWRNGST
jgi:hypothetical protein